MLPAEPPTQEPPTDQMLQWRGIQLDPARHQASAGGRPLDLTLVEFNLLACFLRNPRRLLSRKQLLQDVWSASSTASARTVDTHIYRLRRKLRKYAPCIRTVRGLGYALEGGKRMNHEGHEGHEGGRKRGRLQI